MSGLIYPPELLTQNHNISGFDCGETSLNDWLIKKGVANQKSNASRTFVCADSSGTVLGYYALAAGAVSHQDATSNLKRNMPDPIPVIVLGRLAVDLKAKGMGIGVGLLQDAVKRSITIAENAGVKAILVHAIDQIAVNFYLKHGFTISPVNPMTLFLRLP